MTTITKIQIIIAIAAFVAAIGFAIAGFIVPPPGEIHDSVLYLVAQFLLLTASIFGVGSMISFNKFKGASKREQNEEDFNFAEQEHLRQ